MNDFIETPEEISAEDYLKQECETFDGLDFYVVDTLGAAVAFDGEDFFTCPLYVDGSFDVDDYGQVTAPEQFFVDTVNSMFNVNFSLSDFAGR